jgi:hypothetical protein
MKRHIHSPGHRAKMTIRAIIRYGRERGSWPSARELARATRRLGSASTVQRSLARLASIDGAPPVRLQRSASESYWYPTTDGFEIVHVLPFAIPSRLSRKRCRSGSHLRQKTERKAQLRLDVARIFDVASWDERKRAMESARIPSSDHAALPPLAQYE